MMLLLSRLMVNLLPSSLERFTTHTETVNGAGAGVNMPEREKPLETDLRYHQLAPNPG
jgi:hypothetical protein